MIEKKPVTTQAPNTAQTKQPLHSSAASRVNPVAHTSLSSGFFTRENYTWMLAGLAVIALGMFLMSGGKNADPNVFDQKEVYSTTRITIAPLLILIGLGLEVFAIFKKPKS